MHMKLPFIAEIVASTAMETSKSFKNDDVASHKVLAMDKHIQTYGVCHSLFDCKSQTYVKYHYVVEQR